MEKKYLIDSAILGGIVDGILKLSDGDAAKKADVRDWAVDRLDHNIGIAVFAALTNEQRTAFDGMLKANAGEEEFSKFFGDAGISLEDVMQREIANIKNEISEKLREA